MLDDPDRPVWKSDYFSGVPAPAAAALLLLPVMISFQIGDDIFRLVIFNAINSIFVSLMMVSETPTFSFKRMRVKRERVMPMLIVVGLLGAVVASYPWFMLSAITALYLISIPIAMRRHRSKLRAEIASPEKEKSVNEGDEGPTIVP
jgi:CDP-diacylglycerol--serine O-phosphatidyltransferase